jgi:hypothetical protein
MNPQRYAKQKAKSFFMKTNYVRHTSLVLAAGLVLVLGCARPAAETEQPHTVVAPTPAPIVLAQAAPVTPAPAPAPVPAPSVAPDADAPDTNGPAIIQRIPPTTNPTSVTMTPGLSEVVKLAQAGVGEEVILTYVEKYPGAFNVGADQILYLNDLGVSSTVITSMLKHDGSNVAATAPAASVVQTQAISNVPLNQVYPATSAPAPQVETAVAPPPSTEVSYFYDSLSPYGSWIYLSNYGWCWQPTVAVSVSGWRPYSDRGRWYWSDAGWYWNSDYSWGWAAFHYGRWYYHGRCGWVWTPGTVWGPSWVSWRYTDGYCGWAPLPPEAHYRSGVGFTYYGRGVSVGFDFGLTAFHYSFVSYNRFCDYSPYRYYEPRHRNRDIYRNTTVINNYVVGNNNTIINRGVGRETVAARGGANTIREVTVRERSARELTGVRAGVQADQIERRGRENVVYRPELPKTPPPVRTASFGTRNNNQGQSTVARRNDNGTVPSGNNPITINRSTVSGGVVGGSPATTVPSARPARGSETSRDSEPQRGQTAVNRNNNNGGSAVTPRANPNVNTPATPSRGQSESRTGRSLFGDSGANTATSEPQRSNRSGRGDTVATPNAAPQRGNVSRGTEANVAGAVPRSQPQQNYNAPANRVYPQAPTQSRAPQAQQAPGRVETRQPANSSPRGYEQAPRSAVPSYSAPAQSAPRYNPPSAPSGGSQSVGRSSGGGGGGNSGGSGRGESGSRGNERGR